MKPARFFGAHLKAYVLRIHFAGGHTAAQVIHSPTGTVASSASSEERILRPSIGTTGDATAAAKIGKLLGERLLLRGIPAVSVLLRKEQQYQGKVKAMIDALKETGVVVEL